MYTYPKTHQPIVHSVTPFPSGEGKGLASVVLHYGPVVIRAKLYQGEHGMFLGLPSRKNEKTQSWWQSTYFSDRSLLEEFEKLAVTAYDKALEDRQLANQESYSLEALSA